VCASLKDTRKASVADTVVKARRMAKIARDLDLCNESLSRAAD
jgi:DNA-binding phage protein